ncbi:MAG: endolytic transglycosylase MltG [Roseiflexaceae bacterium]|nr:endolytic transglycosylase MltG [Roseiflexaceae bacterium]
MQSLSKTLRAVCLGVALVSVMLAGISYLLLSEIRRPAGESDELVVFVVEPGDSTNTIATELATQRLIRFPLLFSTLVRVQDLDGSLKAGTYNLNRTMTMSQIISSLQVSANFEEITITIIEGMRREEIANLVGTAGFVSLDEQAFLDASADGAAFADRHFLLANLPAGASLEGYLFPDTYRFSKLATADEVANTMLDNFDQKYSSFETEVQVARNVHEIVTMASVVQREASRVEEMPQIAAVFWNRLKPEFAAETGNGKLQSDPTLQYALGTPGAWWPDVNQLTREQIDGNLNPYNTRVQPGLPPGPISAPGLDALRSAARPDEAATYLYFVASCTNPGTHNFATSFDEFQALEQEYLACSQ